MLVNALIDFQCNKTAIYWASDNGHDGVVLALTKSGANVHTQSKVISQYRSFFLHV